MDSKIFGENPILVDDMIYEYQKPLINILTEDLIPEVNELIKRVNKLCDRMDEEYLSKLLEERKNIVNRKE